VFILYLTLNLMAFYGIMGVYVTPSLVVASVLSGFFYGALLLCFVLSSPCRICCVVYHHASMFISGLHGRSWDTWCWH
jgi:hypothetical protein